MNKELINREHIHQDICEELHTTYLKKNADYGNSFTKVRSELGSTAILVRLSDKLERLKKLLLNGNQQVTDESIDDTFLDLANYAIMELVEREVDVLHEWEEEELEVLINENF